MGDFLGTWYGLAIFIAFDVAAVVAVLAIGWRFVFKRLFDILASALCMVVMSPAFLGIYIRGRILQRRTGQPESLIERRFFVGKKGKAIVLHVFRTDGEGTESYNKSLLKTGLWRLPCLFDIFCGKLSFVGVRKLSFSDAAFLSEAEEGRFAVRPGLINPLAADGDGETDYAAMFRSDCRYARRVGLFLDVRIFFSRIVRGIRGEKKRDWMGVTEDSSYADALLAAGEISREDYDGAAESARAEEEELRAKYAPAPQENAEDGTESGETDGAENAETPDGGEEKKED